MKFIVTLNNKKYEVEVDKAEATIVNTTEVSANAPQPVESPSQKPQAAQNSGIGEAIKAPMPGTIFDVKIVQGASVKAGDVLFILEAMKMENEITAPRDGVVAQISVTKGASVNTDDVLVVIKS